MNKILPAIVKFLEVSPVIAAAILPLLFIPATTEYFETAKVSFLIIFTSLIFVAWAIKMVTEKRVSFVKSPFDLAFVILLVTFGLVTVFSPNKFSALFGSYLRFEPSLTFTLTLVVLYYTLSSNLRNKEMRKWAVMAYIFSVALSSLWALLNYLGVFELLPLPESIAFLKSRVFNTTGSLTSLSVAAGVAFTLALGLLPDFSDSQSQRTKTPGVRSYLGYALTAAIFPLLGIVVAYGTLAGWVALGLGFAGLVILAPEVLKKQQMVLIPAGIWAALLLVLIFTPQLSQTLKIQRPSEISLPLGDSWQIASQTMTSAPLFGAGLGRFPYLFTVLKPLSFNSSPLWNLRFDRPFNELLLMLSETGLIGLAALLLLFAKAASFVFATKSRETGGAGVGAAILALMGVYFVTTSNSVISFSLILLLAVLVAGEESGGSRLAERVVVMVSAIKDKLFGIPATVIASTSMSSRGATPRGDLAQIASGRTPSQTWLRPRNDGDVRKSGITQILPYIVLGVSLLMAIFAIPAVALSYGAEYYNRLALNAVALNDGKEAYNNQVKAVSFNPYLDVYQRNLAQLSLGIAANISTRPNISDADKQTVSDLIQEAIRRSRVITEILEPASVANWETRAQVYQGLMGVADGADSWTVDSYARAISLDPVNPNLRILLGGIYFGLKNYDLAANSFAQAVNLKSDSANAHYNLAQTLIALNRKADAVAQYDIVLNLIGQSSPDYAKALKEREALAKAADEEAKAAASNQTSATGNQNTAAPQEKLQVQTPKPVVAKSSVTPLNLGTVKEASPAAQQ